MKRLLLLLVVAGCGHQEWPGDYTLENGIVSCDSNARIEKDIFGSIVHCAWECKDIIFGYEGTLQNRQLARVDEYNTCLNK